MVEIFFVFIYIFEVIDGSGKKFKNICIDVGEDFGIWKGFLFEVYIYKVYWVLGEEFICEEKFCIFYFVEIGFNSCSGWFFGGWKEVGIVLVWGE